MIKASVISGKLTIGLVIIALFMTINCTEEQPLSTESSAVSSIVGIIKPHGTVALVKVKQGVLVDSTYSDSTSGYFKIDNLQVGFYTLEVSAAGFGKYIEHRIPVVSNGATSVGEIQLNQFPEQILSIIPSNGSENIQLTDSCGFEFTTFMDHNSVEDNFSITPFITGHFQWEENSQKSAIYFYPDTKYKTYTNYTIILTTNAATIYGDSLSFEIRSKFTTETVKINTYSPENGNNYVLPSTSIYIRFNTAMNRTSVKNSFEMIQATEGSFSWHSNESFSFIPDVLLATNTQYTVGISINAKDIYGTSLGQQFTLNFTTEPLTITYTTPKNGATYIDINTAIGINFNTNVNQADAEDAFSISPAVTGSFMWIDLAKFTYFPDSNLTADTWYTVTINTSCKDSYGKSLPTAYSFSFKTK